MRAEDDAACVATPKLRSGTQPSHSKTLIVSRNSRRSAKTIKLPSLLNNTMQTDVNNTRKKHHNLPTQVEIPAEIETLTRKFGVADVINGTVQQRPFSDAQIEISSRKHVSATSVGREHGG